MTIFCLFLLCRKMACSAAEYVNILSGEKIKIKTET